MGEGERSSVGCPPDLGRPHRSIHMPPGRQSPKDILTVSRQPRREYFIEGQATQHESEKESLLVHQSGSGLEPLSETTLKEFLGGLFSS